MDTKYKVLIVVAVGVLGYAFGRYAQPAKIQIKTETVIKEVQVEKRNVVTETHEIKHTDGTTETVIKVTDLTKVSTKETSDSKTSETITFNKPQWKVQALLATQTGPVGPLYGVDVERRILGPISAGAWGNTDKKFGASISIEF